MNKVTVKEIKSNELVILIDGNEQTIKYDAEELKKTLNTHNATSIQFAGTIYNIDKIDEAFFSTVGSKAPPNFNQLLTSRLIEIMSNYDENIKNFLDTAKRRLAEEWNKDPRVIKQAREKILMEYPGILSIQLRKLFAIGHEPNPEKVRKYIKHCTVTANILLRLVNAILLSHLWEHKENFPISIDDIEKGILRSYFDDEIPMNIKDNYELLITLLNIYDNNNLKYPIAELSSMKSDEVLLTELKDASIQLQILMHNIEEEIGNPTMCLDAEHQLVTLLTVFQCLSKYKMISVKAVKYNNIYKTDVFFIHRYLPLEGHVNLDRPDHLKCESYPIESETIILYEKHYNEGITLSPFLIDINALTLQSQSKIYLFDKMSPRTQEIDFISIEDYSTYKIAFKGTQHSFDQLNKIIGDEKALIQYKLDLVFSQFKKIKEIILS